MFDVDDDDADELHSYVQLYMSVYTCSAHQKNEKEKEKSPHNFFFGVVIYTKS